jgi:hypothetical protein
MSFQRAVVNCRRCYSRAEGRRNRADLPLTEEQKYSESVVRELRRTSYDFQNRAMQALEQIDTMSDCVSFEERRDALWACMNCQYKQPEIAEIFCPSEKQKE